VGKNVLRLDLPPYMSIYFVINANILKSFEPYMLDEREEELLVLQEVEDLMPNMHTELELNAVLQRCFVKLAGVNKSC
jgi:hypothetical protein